MKKRVIVEYKDSDRNIVLFFDDKGLLEGVSYWQGIGDFDDWMMSYIAEPCQRYSKYVLLAVGEVFIESIDRHIEQIDKAIWDCFHIINY